MERSKKILEMPDYEIEDVIRFCFDLFGQQPSKSLAGFVWILKQKFNFISEEEIKNGVTNYVSGNFTERHNRFTPSVLSHIVNSRNKGQQSEYRTYEATEEEKAKYKQQWIEAVCADFDDYCNKIPPSRIFVWRLLSKQLMAKGLITKTQYEDANKKDLQAVSFNSQFKPLCLKIFNDMAMQGKHISTIISCHD